MSVSNEDRDAAVRIVRDKLPEQGRVGAYTDLAIVNALIAAGWRPQAEPEPVSRSMLDSLLRDEQHPQATRQYASDYLRELGIEVTD